MVLDHICRNRACINPDHLEVVTSQVNVARGAPYRLRTYCRRGHHMRRGSDGGCVQCGRERVERWLKSYKEKNGRNYVPPCRK